MMKTLVTAVLLIGGAWAQARSVTMTWVASTSTGSAYNVYRASVTCPLVAPVTGAAPFAKIGSTAVGIVTYTDSTVVTGATYCYYVTATLSGLESAPSNTAQAIIVPLPPTGLTVTPSIASVKVGKSITFSASGGGVPNWSISPAIGRIDQTGFYTAPAKISGSAVAVTIVASLATTGERATARLTVTKR